MTQDPRTTTEVYESMRSALSGKIAKLTNFTDRSFNYVWTQAFSREVRDLEVQALAAELAGWIDYSGGPITEEDLEELGLEDVVEPEEINQYMEDEQLDEYVKIVGISRFEGSRATGSVTITTQSDKTEVPEGTVVSTKPDASGDTISFETTQQVESANGVTTITDVPIQANEVGTDYNVPANTIVSFDSPPVGVKGVTNPESTTGGEERESNEELRTRAKQAVQTSSEGGTTDGIRGYVRQNVEGVGQGDIIIDEFTDAAPPFVDVIVDGGLDSDVSEAIEFSRPAGIRHNLVRPQIVQLGWDISVLGSGIDTLGVEEDIDDYLLNLGIGENFYEDAFTQAVMQSDEDIISIDNLGGYVERVTNETFTYSSSTSEYRLDFTYEDVNGSITVEDVDGVQYTQGSDFEVQDQSGDGWPETLVWIGATPDDGEKFFVDYDVTVPGATDDLDYYDSDLVRDEQFVWKEGFSESFDHIDTQDRYELGAVPFDGTSSITDDSGDTYTEGTDYEIVDDSGNGYPQTIDWTAGGARPDDNETFTITYDVRSYYPEYKIVGSPGGIIRDASGDLYNEDTEYELVDLSQDTELDAIVWNTGEPSPDDNEEFFFSYLTEGDRNFDKREKADPGTVDVTQV